jgi:hypothetical protein
MFIGDQELDVVMDDSTTLTGPLCQVPHPRGPHCTLPPYHFGPHVAGDSNTILAIWSDRPVDLMLQRLRATVERFRRAAKL